MRGLRTVLLSLALGAVTLTGCFITQAQILAHFGLTTPITIGPPPANPFRRELVDLNTVDEYVDNKDSLEGLSDLAVIGTFTNVSATGSGGTLEMWITAGDTNLADDSDVMAQGTKLWGPKSIGGPGSVVTIGWDESAALFNQAGKDLLIEQIKGNGIFTAYILSVGDPSQTFDIDDGGIILVLSGGM